MWGPLPTNSRTTLAYLSRRCNKHTPTERPWQCWQAPLNGLERKSSGIVTPEKISPANNQDMAVKQFSKSRSEKRLYKL
jgi:hypothetical protein